VYSVGCLCYINFFHFREVNVNDLNSKYPTLSQLYFIMLSTLSLLTQRKAPTCFSWLQVGISHNVQYRGYDLVECTLVSETDTNVSQESSAFIFREAHVSFFSVLHSFHISSRDIPQFPLSTFQLFPPFHTSQVQLLHFNCTSRVSI
jgi:hypothetical protein